MLTETHLTTDINVTEYSIKNYKICCCYSCSRHTGGVIMYIHDSIQFHEISNSVVGLNWFLAVKVVKGLKLGVYGLVYHSPNDSDNEFLKHLELNWFENILNDNQINLIAGDFNINWNNPVDSENLRTVTQYFNLNQKVKNVTRRTRLSETMIDLVFCNSDEVEVSIESDSKISDHETLRIDLNHNCESTEDVLTIKCWKKYSKGALLTLLRDKLPNDSARLLDEKANVLATVLKESVDELVVVRKIKCRSRKKWYTLELKKLKHSRDDAYKNASSSWDDADWQHYKVLRNEYTYSLRNAKAEYTQRKINLNRGNSKQLWKVLKNLWKNKEKPASSINFNGETMQDGKAVCEKFNSYFVESVQEINNSIEDVSNIYDNADVLIPEKWSAFHRISLENLKEAINNISSSSGIDNVNLQVLKDSMEVTGEYLLNIINESLESGKCPDGWKQSVVVPIPKISGTTKGEEYRPINMLAIYEKVLEVVVKNQLLDYLNNQKILIEEQSGFRQKHSCESALNLLLYKWKRMLEEKKTIVVLFLDLKRAFETISRPILLKTLRKYGIAGKVLSWFESYLSSRTQVCQYNGFTSSPKSVPLGVPQGSVLGPLLFIIYINDMKKAIKYCDVNLFADDTVLFIGEKEPLLAIRKMRADIVTLAKWLKFKKLKLNVQKTKSMIITNKKHVNFDEMKLEIDGSEIERVEVFKYLGVYIDHKLIFKKHIDNIVKKVARKYGMLVRLKSQLTFWSKVFLYKSLIAPQLDYCSSVLFLASDTHLRRLQKLQNKFMRFILNCSKYTPIRTMLDTLQWQSVKQRIIFNVLLLIYKLTNNRLPEYLSYIIVRASSVHQHRTRQIDDLRVVPFTMSTNQKSIYYNGIRIFNMLPVDCKNARTIEEFRRKCSVWVKDKYSVR